MQYIPILCCLLTTFGAVHYRMTNDKFNLYLKYIPTLAADFIKREENESI